MHDPCSQYAISYFSDLICTTSAALSLSSFAAVWVPVLPTAITCCINTDVCPHSAETTLKNLATKQRTTIEDIKKKTNYYSTRNLLERYDDTVGNTPKKKPVSVGSRLVRTFSGCRFGL